MFGMTANDRPPPQTLKAGETLHYVSSSTLAADEPDPRGAARMAVLGALITTEWAADAAKIRAKVMPVIYEAMDEAADAARVSHNEGCATTDQWRDQRDAAERAEAVLRSISTLLTEWSMTEFPDQITANMMIHDLNALLPDEDEE